MNNNEFKSRLPMNSIEYILNKSGVNNFKIVSTEKVHDAVAHQEPKDIDLSTCKEVEKAVPKNIPAITSLTFNTLDEVIKAYQLTI